MNIRLTALVCEKMGPGVWATMSRRSKNHKMELRQVQPNVILCIDRKLCRVADTPWSLACRNCQHSTQRQSADGRFGQSCVIGDMPSILVMKLVRDEDQVCFEQEDARAASRGGNERKVLIRSLSKLSQPTTSRTHNKLFVGTTVVPWKTNL